MAVRYFRNGPATTLVASIGGADTVITVADASGFPTLYPYTLILDEAQGVEEVVDVTSAAGNQLTIVRGVDDTTAFPHNSGAVVVHGISARDAREANTHINSTGAVHGRVGDLVGTTDAQTLSSKTFTSSSWSGGGITNATISGGTMSGTKIQDMSIIQVNPTSGLRPLAMRDSGGVERGYIDRNLVLQAAGLRGVNGFDPTESVLYLRGAAGQTADVIDVHQFDGTKIFGVSAEGRIYGTNFAEITDWETYQPGFDNSGATFNHTGRWKRVGTKTVCFNVQITFTSDGNSSDACTFNLPTVPSRALRQAFAGDSIGPGAMISAVLLTSGSGKTVDRILFNAANGTKNLVGDDIKNGMVITVSGVYEEA